jgi:hypothetical protein
MHSVESLLRSRDSVGREIKGEGAEMSNEFNRKPSPKPPFSRKEKRHVEERREGAPWGRSRASPTPCAESIAASVLVLVTPFPYHFLRLSVNASS